MIEIKLEKLRTITIENVTIDIMRENDMYPFTMLSIKHEKKEDMLLAHRYEFWGNKIFSLNYIDVEHKKDIFDWLVTNGIGKKRAKRITDELIKNHQFDEDTQGVKMD